MPFIVNNVAAFKWMSSLTGVIPSGDKFGWYSYLKGTLSIS